LNHSESARPGAEVLRYVRAVKRRLQYVLLPIVLVPCAAAIGLTFVSPIYESSSVVIYEEKLPFSRSMGDMMVQSKEPTYRESTSRLAQIEARLRSASFLSGVVQKLGIDVPGKEGQGTGSPGTASEAGDEHKSRVIESLRKSIKIAETGPDLFKITISNSDKEAAFRLADGVTKEFVDFVTKGQLADIKAAGTFSEDQLPFYEEKVRQSEERLRQYRAQSGARGGRQSASSAAGLQSARAMVDQTESEIAELSGQRKTAKENMDAVYPNAVDPVTLIRSASINAAYAEVAKEEEGVASLLAQGVSTASAMERVGLARERLLSVIQQTVGNTLRGSPDALLSLVSEQVYDDYVIRSLERRRTVVAGRMVQYNRAAGRPEDDAELTRLQQEVAANNQVLQSLRSQLTSSQISAAAQTTRLGVRIEIIEPATRPFGPAGPVKQKIMLLAFLLGPFLGLSFAVLSEYMDDSVKTVGDVTRSLGIPVLGTIPKVPGLGLWNVPKARRWPYVVILVALVLAAGVKLGHGPIMRLTGNEGRGLVVRNVSGEQGRIQEGNE